MSSISFPLEPFDLVNSSLQYSIFGIWNGANKRYTAVIRFVGTIGTTYSIAHDLRFIQYRCQEIMSLDWTPSRSWKNLLEGGLLVDLRDVRNLTMLPEGLYDHTLEHFKTPFRVIVTSESNTLSEWGIDERLMSTDLWQALNDIGNPQPIQDTHDGPVAANPDVEISDFSDMLRTVSDIQIDCFLVANNERRHRIGLIKVSGTYNDTSSGDDDALLISWRLDEFCDEVEPDALVVDVRDFNYIYGDALSLSPDRFPPESPMYRLVARPEQEHSLKFLGITDRMFPDVDSAIQSLHTILDI